jgi:pyruvate/2-oxoglutarate dehydrogenase complex dihydrolipoamide dehydrogenase (E3) component
LGSPVVEVSPDRLFLDDGQSLEFDTLLVAVGRTPRTRGLGLAPAGVATDTNGFIDVDSQLRTSNPRVWAAGDVTAHPQFTHVAGVHGATAASNALLGLRRKVDLARLPRVTFTQPELAAVGVSTHQISRRHRLVTWDHSQLDRAVTDDDTAGFARLVADRRGRIVGATVVGPRAGETLGELALAISQNLRISDLAATMHPYPTYNDAVWNAATEDYFESLSKATTQAMLGRWIGLGRWLGSRNPRLRSRRPGRTTRHGSAR